MSAPGARLYVCVGAGGVGKTTMAAAIALARAARGERVAVVTIDPAPRLARALGFDELGGDPQRVAGASGELWAMRLDPKRTLDELIASLAPDAPTRERALSNRIYRELSSAVAGSQEFSAVAKLYELDHDGGFDAIVLDTPPSRNALDFLDAPARLMRFFEGRAVRVLLAQGGFAARVAGRAGSPVLAIVGRLVGVEVLREITAFRDRDRVDDREPGRARRGRRGAAARPRHGVRAGQLAAPRGRRGGDRVRRRAAPLGAAARRARRQPRCTRRPSATPTSRRSTRCSAPTSPRACAPRRTTSRLAADADAASLARLRAAFPALDPICVPELPVDAGDLDGLRAVARALGDYPRSEASPSVAQ